MNLKANDSNSGLKNPVMINFSSIRELKDKINAFKLLYGKFPTLRLYEGHLVNNDGFELMDCNLNCLESNYEIGTKYITQESMGFKIKVNGNARALIGTRK